MRHMILLFVALLLTGCLEDEPRGSEARMTGNSSGGGHYALQEAAPARMMAKSMRAPTAATADFVGNPSDLALDRSQFEGRRIAETHHLSVETPREQLQERYQRDLKHCISLRCEIVNSNVNSSGYANIHARLSPEKLPEFLDYLATGPGNIVSHQLSSDDKTSHYVDTEAKLKNQRAFRQRLLKLLDDKQFARVSDLLQVEREITRVQSQIDSLTGQIRQLEKVTGKATVQVNYQLPPRAVELKYHDITNSLRYAWNAFLENVSAVIMFVMKALPWLPVMFIGFWLLVKMLRFAFRGTGGFWSRLAFWKRRADTPPVKEKKAPAKKA